MSFDTYEKIKLIPGETVLTGVVIEASSFKGNYGQSTSLVIESENGTFKLLEGEDKVLRQLQRMNLTSVQSMIGGTFKFSKTPVPDKPGMGYLNIDRVKGAPVPTPYPNADAQVQRDLTQLGLLTTKRAFTYEEIQQKYMLCARDAVRIAAEVEEDTDGKFFPSPESVAAALLLACIDAGV
jgi:hypothetical protein